MDNLHYNFIDVKIPDFNPEFFDLWLSKIANHYQIVLGEISFVFCDDAYILDLNMKHLEHDYYTDIITFNYNDKDSLSGDLFVSVDTVLSNSEKYASKNFQQELCRVMCHGLLHLIGFDDKNEEDVLEMRRQEEICLNLI